MPFILFIWYAVAIVQSFMAYGTAYRLAKNGGDNGVALWGWLLLMQLASVIPGLGIYLWKKYRDEDYGGGNSKQHYTQSRFEDSNRTQGPSKW